MYVVVVVVVGYRSMIGNHFFLFFWPQYSSWALTLVALFFQIEKNMLFKETPRSKNYSDKSSTMMMVVNGIFFWLIWQLECFFSPKQISIILVHNFFLILILWCEIFFFPFQLWSDSHTRWWWWWSSKSSSSSWMIILQFEICYHCFSLWMLSKRDECMHANNDPPDHHQHHYIYSFWWLFVIWQDIHPGITKKKTENDQTSNVHSTVRSDHFIFIFVDDDFNIRWKKKYKTLEIYSTASIPPPPITTWYYNWHLKYLFWKKWWIFKSNHEKRFFSKATNKQKKTNDDSHGNYHKFFFWNPWYFFQCFGYMMVNTNHHHWMRWKKNYFIQISLKY